MDGHELIEARFSDSNHLNVITLWKDKDNNVVEQLISADPTQSQWQQLMKHTNEKAVWDRTAEWKIEEKRKFDAYIEPLVEKATSTSTMAETLVNAIANHNDSSELLFKLKLEVFKIEKIKNSKVKKLKTDIRKANTVFELFNVIKNKI